jgi:hypothetical protein
MGSSSDVLTISRFSFLLVGAALAAEIGIWRQMPSGWEVAAAALWALALWTSLFEPLLLLLATACLRLAVRREESAPWQGRGDRFRVLAAGGFSV